jgi:hypothetical protein
MNWDKSNALHFLAVSVIKQCIYYETSQLPLRSLGLSTLFMSHILLGVLFTTFFFQKSLYLHASDSERGSLQCYWHRSCVIALYIMSGKAGLAKMCSRCRCLFAKPAFRPRTIIYFDRTMHGMCIMGRANNDAKRRLISGYQKLVNRPFQQGHFSASQFQISIFLTCHAPAPFLLPLATYSTFSARLYAVSRHARRMCETRIPVPCTGRPDATGADKCRWDGRPASGTREYLGRGYRLNRPPGGSVPTLQLASSLQVEGGWGGATARE